ncbi:ATP-dependent helicase [Spelaeicoccus albus]|uniref:ATP-dependent Lhr-like helicase n=2 Tax=Spelaeicoccus albus TaxID=1280376 RepID=A0A7Z0CZ02_9MICO|nr:ATP-dependent Lhr-like helicase [Spelaeicoccus albus]
MTNGMPARFSAPVNDWFTRAFGEPTEVQRRAWETIADGANTLVVAPTGSGKTLAAFLWAIDRLLHGSGPGHSHGSAPGSRRPDDAPRTRVLYISPLKALAVDVERNLQAPLSGIRAGDPDLPAISIGIRSGDTPPAVRRRLITRPPDILITTPESLYLMLTSSARETLRGVETVIVDEVHAVAGDKRGAHLALSLERLDELLARPAQRIGLSATVRPHAEVARFLGGAAPVTIVAPPSRKKFALTVTVPVDDMNDLPDVPGDDRKRSIWPHIEESIVDAVVQQRSTIVFANSRRLAERLTARLNEIYAARTSGFTRPETGPPAQLMAESGTSYGADTVLARAHHGSVSKEQRAGIEDDLKSGRLRCVVATSSLELGIDMGEVDLVVQVESPPSVASGLQRVGRSGHGVGDVSRGVIYPNHRTDLIHAAVTAERMAEGRIEALTVPANALDVLAQHTIAAASMDTLGVDDWYRVVRRSAPYADLPRSAYDSTLDLLAGKYPSDEFAQLRPRLLWDRDAGTITGRPGASRLAVMSGGTIPDRGLYGVFMAGEKSARVGELDEEMVYESRVGDVFALGATSWRIEEITHDKVVVSPAFGRPGRLPFWKGDNLGRPYELGEALGEFMRQLDASDDATVRSRCLAQGLDERAAGNVVAYLREQRAATGLVPTDRELLVERFRDELGDWRVVLHSPYGMAVHAPWALAVGARLAEKHGTAGSAVAGDDGIVLRVPDTDDDPPGASLFVFDPVELDRIVTEQVGNSALFAARFRESAARALLLPRRNPGRRSPLWQQRQRSAELLAVATRYPDFPIVLEAVRECMNDVYDVPNLLAVSRRIAARELRLAEVETPRASPFAGAMLFGYVASFLYESDNPLAERRAQALSLDSSLLADLLGRAELRELLDSDVVSQTEDELQHLAPGRRIADVEGVADLLRTLGPLTRGEVAARADDADEARTARWLTELVTAGRAIIVQIGGKERCAAVEDAARLRDALGVRPPAGIPDAFTEPVEDASGDIIGRYARTHGPFTADEAAETLGAGIEFVTATLTRLESSGRVVHGEFRPGEVGVEWCDSGVLATLRRRSLAALRSEVEPAPQGAFGRFTIDWHGIGHATTRVRENPRGADELVAVADRLAGLPLPASAWESLILPSRIAGYSPAMLDEVMSAGDVIVSGAGRLSGSDGWIAMHPLDVAPLSLPVRSADDVSDAGRRILDLLGGGGGYFFRQIAEAAGDLSDGGVESELWDLFWAGLIGNDTFAPVRALLGGGRTTHRQRSRPPRARMYRGRTGMSVRAGPPTAAGRWSLLPEPESDPTVRAHAVCEQLLDRHGIVTRGAVTAEHVPGAFALAYKVLSEFEHAGKARRGYFVQGLGAAQFADASTIDRLRRIVAESDGRSGTGSADAGAVTVAATDPANPYGAALPWPDAAHRPGRKAGALVVLIGGELAVYLERGGRTLLTFTDDPRLLDAACRSLADVVTSGRVRRLSIEQVDGGSAEVLAGSLEAAGFRPNPKGWRLDG